MSEHHRSPPWGRSLQELMAALPALLSDRLELLALELHRAGRGMVQMMALVVASAVLAATAWLALSSGLGLALVEWGLSWPLALLAVLLVNLALAWVAVSRARRLLAGLGLPATRRHLSFGAEAAPGPGAQLHRPPFNNSRSEGMP